MNVNGSCFLPLHSIRENMFLRKKNILKKYILILKICKICLREIRQKHLQRNFIYA